MIREPYQVFPYNATISEDNLLYNQDNTLTTNYGFTFHFGGDIGKQYKLYITENNNLSNGSIFESDRKNLVENDQNVYNGDLVVCKVPEDKIPFDKDLLWKLRLYENLPEENNTVFPSMIIQNGQVEGLEKSNLQTTIKSKISGNLEYLNSKDLEDVNVIINTTSSTKGSSIKKAKITKYASYYNEFFPTTKGAFKIGKVVSEEPNFSNYYRIIKKDSNTSSGEYLSRIDFNLNNVILRDSTGVYSSEGLFSETELKSIGLTNGNGWSISSKTIYKLSSKKQKYLITAKGVSSVSEDTYHIKRIITESGINYETDLKRSDWNLPRLYYRDSFSGVDTNSETRFTYSEIKTFLNISSIPTNSDGSDPQIEQTKTILVDTKNKFSCKRILETSFEEDSETILYSVKQKTTSYGSLELDNYESGDSSNYPIVTEKDSDRKDFQDIKSYIIAQDANGNIFSTYNLFTEAEKNIILSTNFDFGYYTFNSNVDNSNTDFKLLEEIQIRKNFYDSNFYPFEAIRKPKIQFVVNGITVNEETQFPIEGLNSLLKSRAGEFTIVSDMNLDIKYYKWDLYRNDLADPLETTKKIFSKKVFFKYGNFIPDFSYSLILTIALHQGGIFQYKLENFETQYFSNSVLKATSNYSYNQNYINVAWPSQRINNPDIIERDGDESIILNTNGCQIGEKSALVYKDKVSSILKINPLNFATQMSFKILRNATKPWDDTPLVTFSYNDDYSISIHQKFNTIYLKGVSNQEDVMLKPIKEPIDSIVEDASRSLLELAKIEKSLYGSEKQAMFLLPPEESGLPELSLDKTIKLNQSGYDMSQDRYVILFSNLGLILKKNNSEYYGTTDVFKIGTSPFNKITLHGKVQWQYFQQLENDKNFFNLTETIDQNGVLTPEIPSGASQSLYLVFGNSQLGLSSKINSTEIGDIVGYDIFREEYEDTEGLILLNSSLIASIEKENLIEIGNSWGYHIKDYTFHNRGYYKYSIVPKLKQIDGSISYGSDIRTESLLYVDNYSWLITSIGKRNDGTYQPIEQWNFILNLSSNGITHNMQRTFHLGNGKYPKVAVGASNYVTTNLSALVGNFSRVKIQKSDNIKIFNDESRIITYTSNNSNLDKLHVSDNERIIFANFNFSVDYAIITLMGQQRYIVGCGEDNLGYYLLVEKSFQNFVPTAGMRYSLYVELNRDNKDEFTTVGEYNTYTDNINIVNNWNNFVNKNDLVLVKDIKGNAFIGVITENSESYNDLINERPTTVNFSLTQVGDIKDYQIFDY